MSAIVPKPPSFDQLQEDKGLHRPAPRRTYGKRAATPADDEDQPVRSVFATTTAESPSRSLLNRWSDNGKDWRASLAGLGSDPPSDAPSSDPITSAGPSRMRPKLTDFATKPESQSGEDTDYEEEAEEIKRQMEKLRRAARGLPAEKDKQGETSETAQSAHRGEVDVPNQRRLVPFSSTLTSLPPSDGPLLDPSSPLRPSDRTSSPERSSTVEIMPRPKDRRAARGPRSESSTSLSEDEGDKTIQRISPVHGRFSPVLSEDGEEQDAAAAATGLDDQFWADIAKESEPETMPDQTKKAAHAFADVDNGMFGSDEDNHKVAESKARKPRPLSKKDMRAMQSGLAEGRRNRAVEVNKLSGNFLPMSSYMLEAIKVISEIGKRPITHPTLDLHVRSSPTTSPGKTSSPDVIIAATPISVEVDRKASKMNVSVVSFDGPASSPTPGPSRKDRDIPIAPITTEAAEDDVIGIESIYEEEQARRAEAQKKEEKHKALAAIKAAALKRLSDAASRRVEPADDNDLEIVPDERSSPARPSRKRTDDLIHEGPNAKGLLDQFAGSNSPRVSKHKQMLLRHAGKANRAKGTLTETHVQFAGKAYNHPGMKRSNAGAVPSGQKKGRENVITPAQLDLMMRRQHLEQAEKIRRKKEEEWGRIKAIPAKQAQDYEAIIAASSNQALEDEESEEEDDDFVPDDEDDAIGDENDDRLEYSGEEEGSEEEDAVMDDQKSDGQDADEKLEDFDEKEATPTLDAEDVPTDTEDVTPKPERRREKSLSSQAATLQADSQIEGDAVENDGIAGFGGDEGGFSQLFEPTQVSGQSGPMDAFAGLRNLAPANLQTDALLPGNNVSDTQAARDNALIAGEVELALDTQPIISSPKKRYMNEHGLLTQTKPASGIWPSSRQKLGGTSEVLTEIAESPNNYVLSSTEKDTSEAAPDTSSPTHSPGRANRLRRYDSPERESMTKVDPKKRHEEDTFARMMRRAQRAEAKAALKSKSTFFDNQAEESDEDGGWAPNGDKDDDDEDGQDEGYIPDLVDDEAIDEEEKKKQDELAAAKLREIEQADDAKREAEARKVIEGQYRNKKRGADFFSDDEDDEQGGKRRKWSKKERRKRRLDREDGLEKLEGEENAFKAMYEAGLDSDYSDDEPESLAPVNLPQIEESMEDDRPTWLILRERGARNRGRNLETYEEELDKEIGFDESGHSGTIELDDEGQVVEEESQFSISRSIRSSTSINLDDKLANRRLTVQRSTDSYAAYVRDESQVNRRLAGAAGVSVVVKKNTGLTATRITNGHRQPSRQSSSSSSKSASVLLQKRGFEEH